MRRSAACLLVATAILMTACGTGERAIFGIGNSGNRVGGIGDVAEDLGRGLAETQAIPPITDETLQEIYAALLAEARQGDLGSALVITTLAAQQRAE